MRHVRARAHDALRLDVQLHRPRACRELPRPLAFLFLFLQHWLQWAAAAITSSASEPQQAVLLLDFAQRAEVAKLRDDPPVRHVQRVLWWFAAVEVTAVVAREVQHHITALHVAMHDGCTQPRVAGAQIMQVHKRLGHVCRHVSALLPCE